MNLKRLRERKYGRRVSSTAPFAVMAEVQLLEDRQLLSGTASAIAEAAVPYLVPTAAGVNFTPILTTGDTVGTYKMAGTPDGLGAFDNGDGTFTLLMNHEFTTGEGVNVPHAHNASLLTDGNPATNPAGSFVDRLVIDKSNLSVLSAGDQIQTVLDGTTFLPLTGNALNFSRFCSADLPATTAFYNPETGLGTQERLFLNGEENGAVGRAFAHVVTGANNGTSYTLPKIGLGGWENLLANPASGDTTLVMANSDGGANRVYAYVGQKQSTGNEIEKAGLTNGTSYSVKDNGDGTFSLVSSSAGTSFARPEDGAWDPNHPNDYYFVTTASFSGNSQLYRLHFDSITSPKTDGTPAGTIEVLINGQAVGKMFDNITMNKQGQIILQEDVGNNPRLGKVWLYDTTSATLVELGQHNPSLFTNPYVAGSNSLPTQDEESSGVIDMSDILGEGTYLLNVQAHYPNANAALVEGGQLLLMRTGAIAGLGYDTAHSNAPALVVLGTTKNDHIEVEQNGTLFEVSVNDHDLAKLNLANIDRVFAVGYDGNDHIDLSESQIDASVFGGDGNDHLIGSRGANYLSGGRGNDKLDVSASQKVSRLEGGLGNDQFIAGNLDQLLDFGVGNDTFKKKKK